MRKQGVGAKVLFVGSKAAQYFKRRDIDNILDEHNLQPNSQESQEIGNKVVELYLSGEVDKIEVIYTNFISMISCEPRIRSLIPFAETGLESEIDEIFKLAQKDDEAENKNLADFRFEQDPESMMKAIVPLYVSS